MAVSKPKKPVKSATKSKAAPKPSTVRGGGRQNAGTGGAGKTALPLLNASNSWLQDATIEVPVPPGQNFVPGSRELDFSVGMRQQETNGAVRTELRGRALVHAGPQVLALVEASYVHVAAVGALPEDLPQQLYLQLRVKLEALLVQSGHTPPLPATLEKVG